MPLLPLCMWMWNSGPVNLRDHIFPRHLAEVDASWLYRSGQISPRLVGNTLDELGIDVIVDLSHPRGDRDPAQVAERTAVRRLGIEWKNFPLSGSGIGAVHEYVGAVASIAEAERAGKRVLVHCRAGDRRTGGVLAAYLLLVKGEDADRAREELERFSRRSASRLIAFLDTNLPAMARGLEQRGTIAALPRPLPALASSSDPGSEAEPSEEGGARPTARPAPQGELARAGDDL